MSTAPSPTSPSFISPEALREHWQGHRRLTRRVIEAFPDDQLFTFSLGGMRTFGDMANELLSIGAPMARGMATGDWGEYAPGAAQSKAAVLAEWDRSTQAIDEAWAQIDPARFHETLTSFGQFTGPGHWQVLYAVDNEIHHRGQGYVYLRALGIEPPLFYER